MAGFHIEWYLIYFSSGRNPG